MQCETKEGGEKRAEAEEVAQVLETLEGELSLELWTEKLEADYKGLNIQLNKVGKSVDKTMPPDLERACRPIQHSESQVNQVIFDHLVRSGRLEIARCFAKEAGIPFKEEDVQPYVEIYCISRDIGQQELDSACKFASVHAGRLEEVDSALPFHLAKMKFLQLLQRGCEEEAVAHARKKFPSFYERHRKEILPLFGCLAFQRRAGASPYKSLFDPQLWVQLSQLFKKEGSRALGLSCDTPLIVCVHAGIAALPKLYKFATVMTEKLGELSSGTTLPIEVKLHRDFQYHSVFMCPASHDNPPTLLQCGHVLCELSLKKLTRSAGRLKCPYCPREVSLSGSVRLTF
ncbi:hypothetical protein GUITHDRAFT_80786 [Guillardia theta CCMP2712]|uniref:CTLH domain-containing protein n=1 Tax=Guillardia theta (strain CCMP2712) TaxID=905079 RepID=L1ID56_GUITC|nr:hypothetical protein GUITHDRAFT_80786 [Guillardia theta CCMP2712]EKX34173.1 hypothetical protein GUITHDRAFT_80786 [Guillardia theta CCMP2712]|eukprot:XP_005821153.1 hypothetical protein GUITHDRAFT_80786 [Guillardia theta CCMP2712]